MRLIRRSLPVFLINLRGKFFWYGNKNAHNYTLAELQYAY
jgi:hypothetical protein